MRALNSGIDRRLVASELGEKNGGTFHVGHVSAFWLSLR
jgi:hypothetical protein